MQREEKHLESTLEAISMRLNDLKGSIGAMIHKLETEYETIHWPTFLDNFAIISSHLTGLSKILSKDFPLIRNRTVLPLKLSPEHDEILLQLTEGRVPIFSHDICPDYLRTKPEPAAEQRMLQHEQKANNLLPETAMKQFTQYNKVISHVFDMVNKAREEWENETNARTGPSQISSVTDTHALVAAIGMGKGLKSSLQVSTPGMMPPGAPNMMTRPSSSMTSATSGANPLGKAPAGIKTNIKSANQIHSFEYFPMAFYSVRVDEYGTEIEPPRTPNLQKILKGEIKVTRNNSARSFVIREEKPKVDIKTNINVVSSYKKVRYVNSAAFIEKEIEKPNKPSAEYENSQIDSNRSHSSTKSANEISQRQYQSHIIMGSNLNIPMLELNSDESFPTSNETSYSYSKIKEVTKIIKKPDAFKEWIKAKKIANMYEKERKKQREDKIKKEREERKQIAELKFKEWTIKKDNMKILSEEKKKLEESNPKNQEKMNTITEEDKEKCFKLWLKNKQNKEKEECEERKRQTKHDEECKDERKKQAEILYSEWLKTAPLKPKPVPLNKGLFTFKGTISDLYINPNPWYQETKDPENSKSL